MRLATIDDYKWLYRQTDYMREGQEERWAYWRGTILEACRGGRVFEFGDGYSYSFKAAMRSAGADVVAWDPAVDVGPMVHQAVDVTCSFDVFEHIPEDDLREIIKKLDAMATRHFHAVANMSDIHTVDGERVELHHIQQSPPWWIAFIHGITGKVPIVHRWSHPCRFLLEW